MAFSGIQEHNEARRKQMHMERLSILHNALNVPLDELGNLSVKLGNQYGVSNGTISLIDDHDQDKYRTTFETELIDRNRINSESQSYHSCCVARRRYAYDVGRSIPSCRILDTHCPHVCRVESKERDIVHRPIGIPQPSYKCAYDATPNGMAVSCHHSANCYAQDAYLINPDNQPDLWKGRPNAYRVPIGYRPSERLLPNYDFKQRPARTFTCKSHMRADGNETNQYTPYAEMFSAKLPKRFTTTDYLMQW